MQDHLTIEAAARRAGVSRTTVYGLLDSGVLTARGTPQRVAAADVDAWVVARRGEALARVGDPLRLAEHVRARALQLGGGRGTRLPADVDAVAVFGPAAVKAAGLAEGAGCRWCWARMSSMVYGGLSPQLTDAHRVLLGEPCRLDLEHMREQLFARERAGKSSAGPSPASRAGSPVRARTAAAKTETWPSRYVGHKRCGTPVGQWCACHPGAKPKAVAAAAKPRVKVKPPRRVGTHPCSCQCGEHQW